MDRDQFRFASEEERIFLTRNHRDFIELAVEFYRVGETFSGVLLVRRNLPNDRPARIAHALKRWADVRADMPATFEGVDFLERSPFLLQLPQRVVFEVDVVDLQPVPLGGVAPLLPGPCQADAQDRLYA